MMHPAQLPPQRRPALARRRALAFAALLGVLALPAAGADSTVRIKLATLAPKSSLYHRVLQNIGETIRSSEGPGASVTIYTDGSQGGEADVVRRMRVGQLNAAMMSVVGLSDIDETVGVLQKIPLAFRSVAEVEYVGHALRPEIERRLLAKGFVAVMWAEAGWVRFFSRDAVAVPSELKLRRMFAWAGDPDQVEMMKDLGYRPVVLETADIIPGLQTGLIDTVALTPMWALATQVDGLAPHMIDLKWAPIAGALVIARPAWEAMSPATQAAVRKAAERATEELGSYQARADLEAIVAMEKRGLKVIHLSPEQERQWYELAAQIYPRIRGRTVPAATFDAAMHLLAEYRSASRPADPPR